MPTSSSSPQGIATGRPAVAIAEPMEHAVAELWRQLSDGFTAPWLDEIASLRVVGDGVEASLDIWSVALTAALKDPDHREIASRILARLGRL